MEIGKFPKKNSLDRKSHRLLSVSDSSESKTAAPINRYVNVHTTRDNVRTFCRFIVHYNSKITNIIR